jgi:hypothetical protein
MAKLSYQKIFVHIWDDEKFYLLSKDAKLVWFNLLTSNQTNFIGFYVLKLSSVAEDTGLTLPQVNAAMKEIIDLEMVIHDEKNRVILIRNHFKLHKQDIQTLRQKKGVINSLRALPKTELLSEFQRILPATEDGELIDMVNAYIQNIEIKPSQLPKETQPTVPAPKIPVESLVEAWNQICVPLLPQVISITETRETHIKKRLTERPDIEEWKGIFTRVIKSPFLCGENNHGFKATFDWVLKPTNLQKIIEGNYDDQGKNVKKTKVGMDALAEFVKTQKEKEAIPIEQAFDKNQLGGNDGASDVRRGDGADPDYF